MLRADNFNQNYIGVKKAVGTMPVYISHSTVVKL